jgi:hypothetical protein
MSYLVKASTQYRVVCRDALGRVKWIEEFPNIVMTAGKNKLLDATLKTGLTSPAWFIGLVDDAGFSAYAAADTMASHAGWAENDDYDEATREAWTPGTISAGSVDNSASPAVFTISATVTIRGCFMADESTKAGSTGTLYGAGDFSAARAVVDNDTLTVTVTPSVS